MSKYKSGFTIVELIIVIVVIAVLSAISMVVYAALTSRAHDAAVKSDLSQMASKLRLIYTETGAYPPGGGTKASAVAANGGAGTSFPGFQFSVSKGSYDTAVGANFVYCLAPDGSGDPGFIVRAKSKSGTVFEYNSTVGSVAATALTDVPSEHGACGALGGWPRSWSYGFFAGSWRAWTD